jgi:hypothetical protein
MRRPDPDGGEERGGGECRAGEPALGFSIFKSCLMVFYKSKLILFCV